MNLFTYENFLSYWSLSSIEVNLVIFANLVGSMLLGLLVGYERSYHGRAAGMRTYGLVCMASTAIVVFVGYPEHWFGSIHAQQLVLPDVTRVIQGIVTGIGFLGAGVIMKEGFTISGLTTAASIWTVSGIGILVGVGFYFSAILLSLLAFVVMMWGFKLESWLPSRHAIAISLTFKPGIMPNMERLLQTLAACDYSLARSTVTITSADNSIEWRFVAVAHGKTPRCTIPDISSMLQKMEEVSGHYIAFARN